MNYYAMRNAELACVLEKRGLLTPQLGNQLRRIYGVTYVTPQEESAKEEAIKILQAADESKLSIPKSVIWVGILLALIASAIEVVKTGNDAWRHFMH